MTCDEEGKLFHEGVRLFNEGEWFEAHEVWEDIWRLAGGEKRRFYQGIIQCAVTLEHMRRGNPRGVLSVLQSATAKFAGMSDVYMGVRVRQLLDAITVMTQPIRHLPPEMFEPRKGRGLDLPIDLNQAPQIELAYDPFAATSE